MVSAVGQAHGAHATLHYERRCPPTINDSAATAIAIQAAANTVTAGNVETDSPSMACDDIGWMLAARPGTHVHIGNGDSQPLHHSGYDFDDRILALGASFWARLAETALARKE
jgi:metal-dependent amidase/aminoacylase/carboxypeptidase family protein